MRRASWMCAVCVVPLACGSSGTPASQSEGSASTTESSESDSASGAGVELPPGCGDGIVDPEQFCFEPILIPGLAEVQFIHGLDLDGDGRDELVVGYRSVRAGDFQCDESRGGGCLSVFVFEDEAFVHRQTIDSGSLTFTGERHVVLEDFDRDGRVDLGLLSAVSGAKFSLFRNVGGVLGERELLTVIPGSGFGMMAPVDPDGDGMLDYLVPWKDGSAGSTADHIQLRRKVGDEFAAVGPKFELPPCWSSGAVAVGDLTGNGLDDAVFVSELGACDIIPDDIEPEALFQAFVFFANAETGLMEAGPRLPRGGNYNARRLWIVDVNADGHLDIVFSLQDAEDAIIVNRGDGTFEDVRVFGQISEGEAPKRGAAWVADFNGDGRVDVLGGGHDETARGFLVDPLGERRVYPPAPADALGPTAKADVNGDGIMDMYRVENTDDPLVKRVYILVSRP